MTLEEARAAKETVRTWLKQHPEIDRDVNGIGIGAGENGGYGIVVNFENRRGLAKMPAEVEGITVTSKFVGRIVAL